MQNGFPFWSWSLFTRSGSRSLRVLSGYPLPVLVQQCPHLRQHPPSVPPQHPHVPQRAPQHRWQQSRRQHQHWRNLQILQMNHPGFQQHQYSRIRKRRRPRMIHRSSNSGVLSLVVVASVVAGKEKWNVCKVPNYKYSTKWDGNILLKKMYANLLMRKFSCCSVSVKCYLFKTYCSILYCTPMWFDCPKTAFEKLKVVLWDYHGVTALVKCLWI